MYMKFNFYWKKIDETKKDYFFNYEKFDYSYKIKLIIPLFFDSILSFLNHFELCKLIFYLKYKLLSNSKKKNDCN